MYSYQWVAGGSDISGATGSSHLLTTSEQGQTIQVRVTFTDDANNEESLTSEATVEVTAAPVPLTASFLAAPSSHDGDNSFTFELRFSEEVEAGYARIRDDAFNVTGGDITQAQRKEQSSNQNWTITVEPDGNGQISITLPSTTGCDDTGAICTGGGKKLSGRVELTVNGPEQQNQERQNTPAAGAPTISGTPQVGETLTADTSGISDAEELTNVSYRYQWLARGSDIQDATGSSYLLTTSEQGQTIQVKVNFTDDADNQESLTSAETLAVAARPNTEATGAPTISGTPQVEQTPHGRYLRNIRRQRAEQRLLPLPVAAGRRRHRGADQLHLRADLRRRGQDHQGTGDLHRRCRQRRVADQHCHNGRSRPARGDAGRPPDGQLRQRARRPQRQQLHLPAELQRERGGRLRPDQRPCPSPSPEPP